MATYAIGDLQGCYVTLQSLLQKISFDRVADRLWFVGDLVNRGPGSLECLRFVSTLGESATTVLGNHDLHLLALAEGFSRTGKHDTLQPIIDAPDRDELLGWLRRQKLLHVDGGFAMVHAGLMPQWNLELAQELADDVSQALQGRDYRTLLKNMYGNTPDQWRDDLTEIERFRITINAMTRMRIVTPDNRMDLTFKGELTDRPAQSHAWFEKRHASFACKTLIGGHWSALGLHVTRDFVGIDTGCVWGRQLTAFRLDDREVFQVPCAEATIPLGLD